MLDVLGVYTFCHTEAKKDFMFHVFITAHFVNLLVFYCAEQCPFYFSHFLKLLGTEMDVSLFIAIFSTIIALPPRSRGSKNAPRAWGLG